MSEFEQSYYIFLFYIQREKINFKRNYDSYTEKILFIQFSIFQVFILLK